MALTEIGNRVVVEGVGKAVADLNRYNGALAKTNHKLAEQAKAAAQASLPDPAQMEAKSRTIGQRVLSAITAPFRLIGNLLSTALAAAFSIARTLVVLPAKIIGMLFVNALKAIIVSALASYVTNMLFKPLENAKGAETAGQKNAMSFVSAFAKHAKPYMESQLQGAMAGQIRLAGGPVGAISQKIADTFLGMREKAASQGTSVPKMASDALNNAPKAITDITSKFQGFTKVSDMVKGGWDKISGGMTKFMSNGKMAVLGIGALVAALVVVPIVLGAVGKAFSALNALGQRGAQIEGLAMAFDNAAERAGLSSNEMLTSMREASLGMVSDVDMIKRANLALAGATGQVANQMGKNLPELMKIARAQARATGQDVNFLFESLTTGIKRGSPMLIDNTGLVLKIGQANEMMAEKLGKSVEALSAEEKQLAILNATLEAGRAGVEALGNAELTAAEISQQISASRENMMNTLAASVQPVYKAILGVVLVFQQAMTSIATALAPIILIISQIMGEMIGQFMWAAGLLYKVFVAPIVNELQYVIFFLYVYLNAVKTVISWSVKPFMWLAGKVGEAMKWVGKKLAEIFPFLNWFKGGLFRGAAAVFGAFASGILYALNAFIYPAVIAVAKAIADFLMGQSPPPVGPLSQIDKGGANVMMAWMEGFAGVSMEPVARVAQDVVNRLGPVAYMSLDQVKSRLAELDAELKPFQDRLKLVQAQFEAFTAPYEKAKTIIAKRLDDAVKLMTSTGMGAEQVRAMDKQMEMINQRLSAAQSEKETYELQLALAQARQAEERAALEIRQSMLGVTEQIAQQEQRMATDSPISEAAERAAKAAGGGGGGAADAGEPGGGAMPGGGGGSIMDSITGMDGINNAGNNLAASFKEGFMGAGGAGQLGAALGNQAALNTQVGRIKEGIGSLPDRIAGAFTSLPAKLGEALVPVFETFEAYFGPEGKIRNLLVGEDSLFSQLGEKLVGKEGVLTLAFDSVKSLFSSIFSAENAESVVGIVMTATSTMLSTFITFADNIGLEVDRIALFLHTLFTDPMGTLQTVKQSVSDVLTVVYNYFLAFASGSGLGSIGDALSSLSSVLTTSLKNVFISALQGVANALARALNGMVQAIVNGFDEFGAGFLLPEGLKNIVIEAPQIGAYHKGGMVRGDAPEGLALLKPGEGVLDIPMVRILRNLENKLARPSYSIPVIGRGGGQNTVDRSTKYDVDIHNHYPTDSRQSLASFRRRAMIGGLP
jgi:hypothetical protein